MIAPSLVSPAEPTPRRRIRVLTLVDGIGIYGGGEILAREITMRLDPDRFEPILCVTRWEPGDSDDPVQQATLADLAAAGVGFIGLKRVGKPAILPWGGLIRALRSEPVDVIHAHKFGSNLWGAMVAPLAAVPVLIAHEHTWSFEGRPLRKLIDRRLIARSAAAVVAVSEADRMKMIEIVGLDPAKVVTIPNGIPDPTVAPDAGAQVRAELGIGADQLLIGTVATIRRQKALDVLIEATAKLVDRHPDLRVVIAGGDVGGDRTLRDELLEQARRLGVADRIMFIGLRTDIPAVIDAFDVAVLSSDFEGSPLSVMEYMEAGVPIVSTTVGGLGDLITDGEHGRLVAAREPAQLAEAIEGMVRDRAAALRMAAAARRRRRSEFSIEATVGRVEELYERCLSGRPPDG